ncbi:hypothetical protein [Gordonia sihwensis]|uniref:hypothetical protein n=1 Tax=Gordonia sihwensis TaxID=173559 RepID=UPI0006981B30|nr:hypothetical protein [Gordonia sihwensis]
MRRGRRPCIECGAPSIGRARCTRHYEAYRTRQKAYGQWTVDQNVDAADVIDMIGLLRQAGMPLRLIAATAELSPRTVSGLLDGTITTVSAATADRIAALPIPACWPLEAPDSVLVDSVGTVRRLQALAVLGWSYGALAERLGTTRTALGPVVAGHTKHVKAQRARAVRDLYNELSMTFGGSARTVTVARKNGWVAPLAWDDDTIDDPAALPDTSTATVTTEDRIAEYEWLCASGVDPVRAAGQAGISTVTIRRHKQRAETAA